jgi:hypothetical protein
MPGTNRELIYRGKTKQFISNNYPWMGIAGNL